MTNAAANTASDNVFARAELRFGPETTMRLAMIVRAAHTESDVWAGCRVADAFGGHAGGYHAGPFCGAYFVDYVDCYGDVTDLSGLREMAWAYLEV